MKTKLQRYLWRLFLRLAGNAVTAAEDWIHAQEVKLREESQSAGNAQTAVTPAPFEAQGEPVKCSEEFAIKASAARERVKRAARPRRPRLVYQSGQFVRQS